MQTVGGNVKMCKKSNVKAILQQLMSCSSGVLKSLVLSKCGVKYDKRVFSLPGYVHSRVGHGLDPSMDWIGLGGLTVTPFKLVVTAAQWMLFLTNYDL